MVANTSKRRLSTGTKVTKKSLATTNFKPKVVVKENDRIARMKAAREAYSKLSKDRSVKSAEPILSNVPKRVLREVNVEAKENEQHCSFPASFSHDSPSVPAEDIVFKPVKASLDMIRNGGIRMPATGRYSSIGGIRSLRTRPSLLPLGINVFDSKVSANDQRKVREFIAARYNSAMTPKKVVPSPCDSSNTAELYSLRSLRTVRFCNEIPIEEQRESNGDGQEKHAVRGQEAPEYGDTSKSLAVPPSILKNRITKALMDQEPSASISTSYGRKIFDNTSSKKRAPEREHCPSKTKSRLTRLQSPLASNTNSVVDFEKNSAAYVNGQCLSRFVQCFTWLFNMNDEEWAEVEPIMLNQLIDLLQEKKGRGQGGMLDADSSELLPSLPDDIQSSEPKKAGFRKVGRRWDRTSNVDLQVNQEVVLINGVAKDNCSPRRSLRLRQRDPVSRILGGDSPFAPIRGSPLV